MGGEAVGLVSVRMVAAGVVTVRAASSETYKDIVVSLAGAIDNLLVY
jgi:hypothetical protein